MAQQTTVRRIEVRVDARDSNGQLKQIAKGFSDVNRSIKGTTTAVTSFRNAFLALQGLNFAGFGIGSLVGQLDQIQKLNDRLRLTEGSVSGADRAFRALTDIANENRTSVNDLALVYNRLNLSLKDTGISTDAVLGLTDTLQKSFRISGSTASEAAAATIQLSQGLASGQLRGQELRSVLEQNALIGGILAKSLGIARGELIKFAEKNDGISSEQFLRAVASEFGSINAQANTLAPTIGETLTTNFNRLRVVLNDLNREFLITERVSSVINFAFNNLDIAAGVLGIAASVKAYTFAVQGATAATAAFNAVVSGSLFFRLASSPVVGGIVQFVAALGAVKAALAGIIAVTAAGAVGLTLGLIKIPESAAEKIRTLADRLGLAGEKSKSLRDRYFEQVEATRQLEIETRRASRPQTEIGLAFERTINTITSGNQDLLIFTRTNKDLAQTYITAERALTPYQKALTQFIESGNIGSKFSFNFKEALAALNNSLQTGAIDLAQYNSRVRELQIRNLTEQFQEGAFTNEEYNKRLDEIKFGKLRPRIQQVRGELAALNAEFGLFGNVQQYGARLNDLTLERTVKDFEEGRINLQQLNKAFADADLRRYNTELQQGALTLQQFQQLEADTQLRALNNEFKAGALDVRAYNEQLIQIEGKFRPGSAFFVGTNNYIKQAGTLSQNVANGITQTFSRLEDFFVDFTRTGKFAFREFAAAVIDDLNKIIVRALIIRPLAQGILSFAGSETVSAAGSTDLATGSSANFAARGASFSGNRAEFFAKGGVVDSATPFTFAGRKLGVMGEKGPEAILPLRRTSSGDLGVKAEATPANVVVNIINQGGNEVEQRETTNASGERVLDIIILNKVKEGISNGLFDRTFQQQFGLSRRGA